jgi:4'-phosphopantetheinyl transferase
MTSSQDLYCASARSIYNETKGLKGSELVNQQRLSSRDLLYKDLIRHNVSPPGIFPQLPEGKPLPFNGIYWSLSHKPQWVASMFCKKPCGIDIEIVRPRKAELLKYAACPDEWELTGVSKAEFENPDMNAWIVFYIFWTAKEAFLKAIGTGLKFLSKCRVIDIPDSKSLVMQLDKKAAHELEVPEKWVVYNEKFYDVFIEKWIIISYTVCENTSIIPLNLLI